MAYSGTSLTGRLLAATLIVSAVGVAVWEGRHVVAATPTPTSKPSSRSKSTVSSIRVKRMPTATAGNAVQQSLADANADQDSLMDDGLMDVPMNTAGTYTRDKKPIDREITFVTDDAERRVRSFQIDCYHPGTTVRLMDVLRRLSSEGTRNGLELRVWADSRGQDVRIYDQLLKYGEPLTPQKTVMEIDEWDEIHMINIRREAIWTSCEMLHQND